LLAYTVTTVLTRGNICLLLASQTSRPNKPEEAGQEVQKWRKFKRYLSLGGCWLHKHIAEAEFRRRGGLSYPAFGAGTDIHTTSSTPRSHKLQEKQRNLRVFNGSIQTISRSSIS